MKKSFIMIVALLLIFTMMTGCGTRTPETAEEVTTAAVEATPVPTPEATPEPTPTPTPEPTPEPGPVASYVVDFEKPELFGFKSICFNEAMTETNLMIEPAEGFTGNALKGKIAEPEAGNTWWVVGLGMDKSASNAEMFNGLSKLSFQYASTVEFKDVPFFVQIVWKDKDTGAEVTKIEADFPMEKTTEPVTYEINVPEDVKNMLTISDNCYLDWTMIGLKDKAGDAFRPGTMTIDNISFYNDPEYKAPEGFGPKPLYTVDFETLTNIGFSTICFNEELSKTNIAIEPVEGFMGNAVKAKIAEPEAGNTWWVVGLGMIKEASVPENFKALKSITLNYTSTVEFKEVPFMVQLVWKDKDTGDEVAKIEADFPVEKTADVSAFSIVVPEDIATKLSESTNYYLDWVMIGLRDKAGDAFRPGTIVIDDISFMDK